MKGDLLPAGQLTGAVGHRKKRFVEWAFGDCESLRWMEAIANGSKHFDTGSSIASTHQHDGDWARQDWDITRLGIETEDGEILPFDVELDKAFEWWQSLPAKLPTTRVLPDIRSVRGTFPSARP